MKAETLLNLSGMICPRGTRPLTVHTVTECKEVGGTKESWFTIMGGADGVKASETGGYQYKGGPRWMERLSRMVGRHIGNGSLYFLVSLNSVAKKYDKTGNITGIQWRNLYRDGAGKVCPPPPKKDKVAPSDDWKERPYKLESVKSIRYGGKTYT